jgi:colicin import membrane protein
VTTTRQHIEDLDVDKWARLTRRAAVESVESSKRLGLRPRPESVAIAAMSERELVEHRQRHGPAKPRPSLVMQLVEADQRSREAESQARDAHQGRLDAEAAASMARAEADDSARAVTAAQERIRAVEAESARKDGQRVRDRAADQQAVQLARAETEQARADAAAGEAAAQERVRSAEARAEQRMTERAAERAAGEKALQQLQAQLDKVRADAEAEKTAAKERVRAAEARAEQRVAERATERATGEEAVARVRGESEKVRADAAAEVAAARGQAAAKVAAARQTAEAEIDQARQAAQAEIDNAHAYAEDVVRQAQADVARATSMTTSSRLLTIPIPPAEVRAGEQIRPIESAVDALYQIDYVLEIGMAEEVSSQPPPDVEFMRNLMLTVQERAKDLSPEFAHSPVQFTDQSQMEAAASYLDAAGGAFRACLQRIEGAVHLLGGRNRSQDAEIIEMVMVMLADPWVQAVRQHRS